MPDPTDNGAAKPGEAKSGSSEVKPESVSLEQYNELLKRLDGQSKAIAAREKAEKELREQLESIKQPSKDPLTDRIAELEKRDKAQRDREKKLREREINSAIEREMVENGVDPQRAKREARLVQLDYDVDCDDDSNVTIKDGDKVVSVTEWMRAYIQSDVGKTLLPPKRNPTSDALNGRTGYIPSNVRRVSSADLQAGRVDPKDIREGKVIVSDSPF